MLYLSHRIRCCIMSLTTIFGAGSHSCADIFQWEYINPVDPSLGKQSSTTLAVDGAGVVALPAANLSNRNLAKAYMIGADLSAIAQFDEFNDIVGYLRANLSGANLRQADLSEAKLSGAMIHGTNLNQANLSHANFGAYQDIYGNSYPGAELIGANLTEANLQNANFFGAAIIATDFSQSNLSNANFFFTSLTDANLTGADVRWANMYNAGISTAQLYSTSSYQAHDLRGINLGAHGFSGANFANQNLAGASFLGSDLSSADLNHASLQNADLRAIKLTGSDLSHANLTNANLRQAPGVSPAILMNANLSHAALNNTDLVEATLTGANLSDADVRGANFYFDVYGTGITNAQLYSTASYQAHDLTGIGLGYHNLSGANFAGQNLTNASFQNANLSGANFSGALVRGAYFASNPGVSVTLAQIYSTASYQSLDLSGITLGGNTSLEGASFAGQNLSNVSLVGTTLADADLSQANLTNANLNLARLTGANFSNAVIRGANFFPDGAGGISLSQLYSTASYQAHELTSIRFGQSNFSGANLASQSLASAWFYGSKLANSDFSQSDLRNAYFYVADLTSANLSGADARGADFQYSTLTGTNTANLIQSDGHISGLHLAAGQTLVVRDHDGNFAVYPYVSPLPVVVDQHFSMNGTGTLRLEFDADQWSSIVLFEPSIPVALGGTLELAFAADIDPSSQLGRTIDLFDWTGVTPTGTFNVSSPYLWNLSNLYITGEVTLTAVPGAVLGDFNGNGGVDASDYVVWRDNYGMPSGATISKGDGDRDGDVDGADYLVWQRQFGPTTRAAYANSSLPEPATALLTILATASISLIRGRERRQLVSVLGRSPMV